MQENLKCKRKLQFLQKFVCYNKITWQKKGGALMRQALIKQEIIDLDKMTISEIKNLHRKSEFKCIRCEKPVIFKFGTRKQAHFSHVKKGEVFGAVESSAHILTKHSFANWLEKQGCRVVVEQRFPQIDRIADVYFEFHSEKYAFEIQKSPISDQEFENRIADYAQIGITVLWIFIGELIKKKQSIQLPSLMLRRNLDTTFHFCARTAKLTIFNNPVFITQKEVWQGGREKRLSEWKTYDLLNINKERLVLKRNWLEIKRKYRSRGWFYSAKSERLLVEQCILLGFNLAMLPVEVGWPVTGDAIEKPLFVWQAFVVMAILKYFEIGMEFGLDRMGEILEAEYLIVLSDKGRKQIADYLKWLIMFGMLQQKEKKYIYKKKPHISSSMEVNLQNDELFVGVVLRLMGKR